MSNRATALMPSLQNRLYEPLDPETRTMPTTTRKEYMTSRERRAWSLSEAILNPTSGLHAEVSQTIARDLKISPKGVLIPNEMFFGTDAQRTMGVTSFADGGATVGVDTESIPIVSYLFPQSVIFRLGARFIGGLKSDLLIPRESASDEAEWLQENETRTDGSHDTNFGGIAIKPHRLYAERKISRQLFVQCAQADAMVARLITSAMAASIDRGALVGSGSDQPLGILYDPNSTTVSIGNDGGAPTLAALNSAEDAVIAGKVVINPVSAGWVVSTNSRRKMKNTQKATGTSTFLAETSDNADRINGYTGFATAFLPDNLAKGSSGAVCGSAIFGGDWSTLIITSFGAFDLLSDTFTRARHGEIEVSLEGYYDVAKTRPESHAKLKDILTT